MGLKTFSFGSFLNFSQNICDYENGYRKYLTLLKLHPTHMCVQKIVDKGVVLWVSLFYQQYIIYIYI